MVRKGGSLTPEDVKLIQDANLNEVIVVNGAPGAPLQDDLAMLPHPPIDPQVYDTTPIRGDIEMVSGAQDSVRGSVLKAKTATEAEIMQQGLMSRTAERQDAIEDWIGDMAEYTAQILLQELPVNEVVEIAGQQAVWPSLGRGTDLGSRQPRDQGGLDRQAQQDARARAVDRARAGGREHDDEGHRAARDGAAGPRRRDDRARARDLPPVRRADRCRQLPAAGRRGRRRAAAGDGADPADAGADAAGPASVAQLQQELQACQQELAAAEQQLQKRDGELALKRDVAEQTLAQKSQLAADQMAQESAQAAAERAHQARMQAESQAHEAQMQSAQPQAPASRPAGKPRPVARAPSPAPRPAAPAPTSVNLDLSMLGQQMAQMGQAMQSLAEGVQKGMTATAEAMRSLPRRKPRRCSSSPPPSRARS